MRSLKLNKNIKKHTILYLKQGIGWVYVTVDFISIGWFELFATRRKRELQNEKFLPTAGFERAMSRLLEWRSNVLSCFGSDSRHLKLNDIHMPCYVFKLIQSKTKNKKSKWYIY